MEKSSIINAGRVYSILMKEIGSLQTVGDNYYGKLGNGTTTNSTILEQIKHIDKVVQVSLGATNII